MGFEKGEFIVTMDSPFLGTTRELCLVQLQYPKVVRVRSPIVHNPFYGRTQSFRFRQAARINLTALPVFAATAFLQELLARGNHVCPRLFYRKRFHGSPSIAFVEAELQALALIITAFDLTANPLGHLGRFGCLRRLKA